MCHNIIFKIPRLISLTVSKLTVTKFSVVFLNEFKSKPKMEERVLDTGRGRGKESTVDVKSVESQLEDWKRANEGKNYIARNLDGIPVPSIATSLTLGECGPVLMQDDNTLELIQDFSRLNPPERIVHAKGIGAHGIFKVTHDITDLTCATVFSSVGKTTPIFSRLSTANAKQAPDSSFDVNISFKFYTEDGNWDVLTRQKPAFPVNDPILFLTQIRIGQVNPALSVLDKNMLWDFNTHVPETIHDTLFNFSDVARPKYFQSSTVHAVNTFKLVNAQGEYVYIKWTFKSNQGYEYLTDEDQLLYRKKDPDFQTRNLFNSIAKGDFPSWTLLVQTMTEEQITNFGNKKTGAKWNGFDVTLVWPPEDYPYRKVGVLTLNKNVENDFNETEQSAFSPGRLVPGIEAPLQDISLQGRLFAYPDAQIYRLGINNQQLQVNRPKGIPQGPPHTYERDGFMNGERGNQGAPNYYPNSFGGPIVKKKDNKLSMGTVKGKLDRFENMREERDFYAQPRDFYNSLTPPEKQKLVKRIAFSTTGIAEFLQERVIHQMSRVDPKFGKMLRQAINKQNQNQSTIKADETTTVEK